jgi:hypothetical protein
MKYLKYTAIKAREYHKALNSIDYLACLTRKEFKALYYNGSSALRGVPMPLIPTLLELHKPGLTPERVMARHRELMRKMQDEIDAGKERRGICPNCDAKKKRNRCPNCDEA